MYTVSAIIPVYNVKKYLTRCLDSVLTQTREFDQIIVIDDGSTDGCNDICIEYAEKHPIIKLVQKENGGLVSAWMEGLKYVETTHICFIDSDDFIAHDYLECLLDNLDEDVDLVSMQCIRYYDEEKNYNFKINGLCPGLYKVDDTIKSVILSDHGAFMRPIAVSRWGKIIRSDLVKRYAGYCTKKISFAEDQQLTVGILYGCEKIKILDEYKYYYQSNPSSILNAYKKNMWSNVIELMQTIDRIPGIGRIPDYEMQYNTQFLTHMSECFLNEYNHGAFTKRYYCEVINSVYIQNALKDYSSNKMRRFDRAICKCASRNSYIGTLIWLHISRLIMYLNK